MLAEVLAAGSSCQKACGGQTCVVSEDARHLRIGVSIFSSGTARSFGTGWIAGSKTGHVHACAFFPASLFTRSKSVILWDSNKELTLYFSNFCPFALSLDFRLPTLENVTTSSGHLKIKLTSKWHRVMPPQAHITTQYHAIHSVTMILHSIT